MTINIKEAISFIELAKLDQSTEGQEMLDKLKRLATEVDQAQVEYATAKEKYNVMYKAANDVVESWLALRK
jgi:hypothetical protein